MYFPAFTWIYLAHFVPCCITEELCTDLYREQTEHSDTSFSTTAFILDFQFKLMRSGITAS